MLILSKIFYLKSVPSFLPVYVIHVFTLLGRIRCMLLFIDLIILPFGPAYGYIRECNLSLFASNIPNWFVDNRLIMDCPFLMFYP